MGEVCVFSLEFLIKGKSTERNRVELDDKVVSVKFSFLSLQSVFG